MAPYTVGAVDDYDDDYYDLSSLFVPVLLDKPKDVTIVLPPFILEDITIEIQEVKRSDNPNGEDDVQVSELNDDDNFPQVDAELHEFVKQKLDAVSGDYFTNVHEPNSSDFAEVIIPMIAPVAMIGGGEIVREVMNSDWQLPEVKISELLSVIPEKFVSEEKIEVTTVMPVIHHELVNDEGDTVSNVTVEPVTWSVADIQDEQVEMVTEQMTAEVVTDSVIEHEKILHDEEVIIHNGEGSDRVRVTLTQKWVDSPKLTVRVNNEPTPVISATIVIQDGSTGHAKIGDEVTVLTEGKESDVKEYVGQPVAYERLPKYDLEPDMPTLLGEVGEVPSREGDGPAQEPEVRARDADSILGALILIGVLLGNNIR